MYLRCVSEGTSLNQCVHFTANLNYTITALDELQSVTNEGELFHKTRIFIKTK